MGIKVKLIETQHTEIWRVSTEKSNLQGRLILHEEQQMIEFVIREQLREQLHQQLLETVSLQEELDKLRVIRREEIAMEEHIQIKLQADQDQAHLRSREDLLR